MTSKQYEWIVDQMLKRHPDVAAGRKQMADAYRKMRSKSPEMARLLYRCQKRAEKQMADAMYGESVSAREGLAKLMEKE